MATPAEELILKLRDVMNEFAGRVTVREGLAALGAVTAAVVGKAGGNARQCALDFAAVAFGALADPCEAPKTLAN